MTKSALWKGSVRLSRQSSTKTRGTEQHRDSSSWASVALIKRLAEADSAAAPSASTGQGRRSYPLACCRDKNIKVQCCHSSKRPHLRLKRVFLARRSRKSYPGGHNCRILAPSGVALLKKKFSSVFHLLVQLPGSSKHKAAHANMPHGPSKCRSIIDLFNRKLVCVNLKPLQADSAAAPKYRSLLKLIGRLTLSLRFCPDDSSPSFFSTSLWIRKGHSQASTKATYL